jgi:hypothetical protein
VDERQQCAAADVEWMTKIQEVLLRAMARKIT